MIFLTHPGLSLDQKPDKHGQLAESTPCPPGPKVGRHPLYECWSLGLSNLFSKGILGRQRSPQNGGLMVRLNS